LRTRPFEVRRLRSVLAVIAAAAVIAPWTVRNAVELYAFVPVATSLGNTLAGTYNSRSARSSPPARWLSASDRVPGDLSKVPDLRARRGRRPGASGASVHRRPPAVPADGWCLEHRPPPRLHLSRLLARGRRRQRLPVWSVYAQNWAFWILGVLAIIGVVTRRARGAPRWLWAVPILLFLTVVWVGAGSSLYRQPVDPFLILLAGCACDTASLQAWRSRTRTLPHA
jgi:hypothetical protein